MNAREYKNKLFDLFDKHVAVGFIDDAFLNDIKILVSKKKSFSRRELLFILHSIGATYDEANEILPAAGHEELYVKRREDAVWKYVLDKGVDGKKIMDTIFPQ